MEPAVSASDTDDQTTQTRNPQTRDPQTRNAQTRDALESTVARPGTIRKGRGAPSNAESRYVQHTVEADPQAQQAAWEAGETDPAPGTTLYNDRTKTLITTNRSPDIPFDQSINPYKGCEHGCIYCFARPTHAFLDLSPGLDFETRIFCKTNVRERLTAELARPRYRPSVIAMGTNTDPYQPAEKSRRVTREVLETLWAHKHPVSIVTKSKLVLRDLDLLAPMAELGLVHVNVSVTTLDNELKTKLEPRTASPAARLRTITELRAAGVPAGAMLAPIIPFINDHEIEALVARSVDAGAQILKYILLRLPLEVKPLFEEWLAAHYPLKADRVMAAVRDTRGGKAYQAEWFKRMVGQGEIAQLIGARFNRAVTKAGLHGVQLPPLRTEHFEPPSGPSPQLSLF